jgi:hypothetical protein
VAELGDTKGKEERWLNWLIGTERQERVSASEVREMDKLRDLNGREESRLKFVT